MAFDHTPPSGDQPPRPVSRARRLLADFYASAQRNLPEGLAEISNTYWARRLADVLADLADLVDLVPAPDPGGGTAVPAAPDQHGDGEATVGHGHRLGEFADRQEGYPRLITHLTSGHGLGEDDLPYTRDVLEALHHRLHSGRRPTPPDNRDHT